MSKSLRYLRYREDSAQAAEIVQGPGSEDQAKKIFDDRSRAKVRDGLYNCEQEGLTLPP
jgi:hypothetical protein